ncbi:unnamed protein product [Rhizophagus irregularis]|nr:unnamed protein product [Rhizophagus irregularis]
MDLGSFSVRNIENGNVSNVSYIYFLGLLAFSICEMKGTFGVLDLEFKNGSIPRSLEIQKRRFQIRRKLLLT